MSNKVITGHTDKKDKFYERRVNGIQIVAQKNRLGEWHGYVNQVYKDSFSNEQEASDWVKDWKVS